VSVQSVLSVLNITDRNIGFNVMLAISQLAVLYFPIGSPFVDTRLAQDEMLPESRFVCDNVLINSYKHTTIILGGLGTIFACSVLIMLLCIIGQPVSSWLQGRGHFSHVLGPWDRLSWESSAALVSLAAAGHAGQNNAEEAIPLRDRSSHRPAAPS